MKLTVPVHPYVKKFLLREYGPEPIQVRANSDLGRVMILPFAKGVHIPPDEFDLTAEGVDVSGFTDQVTFSVGFSFERGAIIPDRILLLSLALTGIFRQALYHYCQGRRTLFNSELSAVKVFLKVYGIDDEVLQESTAIKMAQRERHEKRQTAA